MNRRIKLIFPSLLLFACVSAALADTPIYKWVDAQGQVHYSTVPHSDKAQQLPIQNTSTPNAGTAVTPAAGASTANSPANDARLVQSQPTDAPACKFGRDRLSKYLQAGTLYSTDDKGNKTPLSEADKQKAVNDARDFVKQVCGSGT
jgi:hypothetical protein